MLVSFDQVSFARVLRSSWVFRVEPVSGSSDIYSSGFRVLGLSSAWVSSSVRCGLQGFHVEFRWSSTLQVELALLAATNDKIRIHNIGRLSRDHFLRDLWLHSGARCLSSG